MASPETEPQRETPTTAFIHQTELTFDELIKHASWNVGMPSDTPLRWALTKYWNEDTPRNIQLWIELDESRFIYLTKILRQVDDDDGAWKVHVREKSGNETTTSTNGVISESGEVTQNQYISERAEKDDGEILFDSYWDYSTYQKAKTLPYLTRILEDARTLMPERQENFMRQIDMDKLTKAQLFQRLAILEHTGRDPLE
jgi:hypothetical protein